ncbi:MAG: VOC family protein [Pseudomonadota bacterium]
MKIGAFSVSLNVADLDKSRVFYQALGFNAIGGEASQGWLIMRNGDTTIGLFQGMFDKNILTFNPGWDGKNQPLDSFTDIREIQQNLKDQGIESGTEIDADSSGPASFIISDPDGNPIMFDQHV